MRCVWDARARHDEAMWGHLGLGRAGSGIPESEGLFWIESGQLLLTWAGGDVELGPGSLLAYWPLFERAAKVTLGADDALSWRGYDKEDLERVLHQAPASYARIMAYLEALCPAPPEGTATGRIRRLLETWCADWGPQVAGTVSASEVARLTGASRDAVEMILARWRQAGMLVEEAGAWHLFRGE